MNLSGPLDENILQEENKPVFTLGIAAQLTGIPAHSIRQYIQTGLIIPYKLDSKRNLFSIKDIKRLKVIRELISDRGLNFAGIRALMAANPCWVLRKCSPEDRNSCEAYNDSFKPCWDASQKGIQCRNLNCRDCAVYHTIEMDGGIKAILQTL